jgi:UDP-N-acetyl-D-glucosamine dehydrogenase
MPASPRACGGRSSPAVPESGAWARGTSVCRSTLDVIGLLQQRSVSVTYSDPYIPTLDLFGDMLVSKPLTADLPAASDYVVIITNHHAFDYHLVVRHARLIVDTRNALRGIPHDGTVVVPL